MQSIAESTRSYSVLSHEEREEIMIGRRAGHSLRDIAIRLGRNVSVISREVRANSTEDGRYQACWANARSIRRRKSSRGRPGVRRAASHARVEPGADRRSSPDRIEYGHWEGDTAVSRQSANALMVLQERTLGLTILEKLPRCAPNEMATAVINRLKDLPEEMRRSITFDNGQENRHHTTMRAALAIDTYFCDPYSSWQKGSVEHAVGLTRRFWPKKTDYALISHEKIAMVERRLNTRPRKRFGFLSPLEYAFSVALTA